MTASESAYRQEGHIVKRHRFYPGRPWCLEYCSSCIEGCLIRYVGQSQLSEIVREAAGGKTEAEYGNNTDRPDEVSAEWTPARMGGDWKERYRGIGPSPREVRHLWRMESANDRQGTGAPRLYSVRGGLMEAKKRPPRKLFFSAKGMMLAEMSFLEEPYWAEDTQEKRKDILTSRVIDHATGDESLLEQFAPDAYDLSEALVRGLGAEVKGKRCIVTARSASRTDGTGKEIVFLQGFAVTGVGIDKGAEPPQKSPT